MNENLIDIEEVIQLDTFDATTITSEERMAYCQEIRRKVMDNVEVSEEELKNGIKCLRAERKAAGSRPSKTRTAAPVKEYNIDEL
jgi:hypothetical protein